VSIKHAGRANVAPYDSMGGLNTRYRPISAEGLKLSLCFCSRVPNRNAVEILPVISFEIQGSQLGLCSLSTSERVDEYLPVPVEIDSYC
jgi:hypothetical protein